MKLKLKIQCKDKEGNIGSFLETEDGKQVTETFKDLYDLFSSKVYQGYILTNSYEVVKREVTA